MYLLLRILFRMAIVYMLVLGIAAHWLPILAGGILGGTITAGAGWLMFRHDARTEKTLTRPKPRARRAHGWRDPDSPTETRLT